MTPLQDGLSLELSWPSWGIAGDLPETLFAARIEGSFLLRTFPCQINERRRMPPEVKAMHKYLLLFFCFAPVCRAQTPIDVYVFGGQSNMVGVLGGSTVVLPFLSPNPNVLFNYKVTQGSTIIHESTSLKPLGPVGSTGGSELSFAAAMLSRTDKPIAIVKVAANGTAIYDGWSPYIEGQWYDSLIAKTQETIADLTALGYQPNVNGLFWVHGEGDAGVSWKADDYQTYLTDLIEGFRAEVDSDAPFYFNRLHADLDRPAKDIVWQAQDYIAQHVPDAHLITVNDLALRTDFVHFENDSQLELGRKWADLLSPSADFNGDVVVDSNDLSLWKGSYGTPNLVGDSNTDGVVDGGDFLLWQRQKGAVSPVASIPEPASWTILLGLSAATASLWRSSRIHCSARRY